MTVIQHIDRIWHALPVPSVAYLAGRTKFEYFVYVFLTKILGTRFRNLFELFCVVECFNKIFPWPNLTTSSRASTSLKIYNC